MSLHSHDQNALGVLEQETVAFIGSTKAWVVAAVRYVEA